MPGDEMSQDAMTQGDTYSDIVFVNDVAEFEKWLRNLDEGGKVAALMYLQLGWEKPDSDPWYVQRDHLPEGEVGCESYTLGRYTVMYNRDLKYVNLLRRN